MTSLSSQLLAALNLLTPKTWIKGVVFGFSDSNINTICMCAHGAVQAVCNPQVQKALRNHDCYASQAKARNCGAENAANLVSAITVGKSLRDVWQSRPDWVRRDFINEDKNYGNRDLHFLLGMVGLTIDFNDARDTTLEMVQSKFREAIELAKELEV